MLLFLIIVGASGIDDNPDGACLSHFGVVVEQLIESLELFLLFLSHSDYDYFDG